VLSNARVLLYFRAPRVNFGVSFALFQMVIILLDIAEEIHGTSVKPVKDGGVAGFRGNTSGMQETVTRSVFDGSLYGVQHNDSDSVLEA